MGLHWGVAGAAGATVIAQVFSGVYCLRAVRRVRILKIEKRDLLPGRKLAFHLLGLGTPVATQNGIISVGGMVVQTVINRYGMLFIAGFTATNKLYGLLEIAATSYGYAVTSYVGQNLGAGQVGRIRQGMRAATWVALGTSVVIAGSMAAFGGAFLRLFIGQEQAGANQSLEIAYHYLLVMSVCLPILYMLHIYRSALMGLGDTVVPMVSGFAEMVMRVGVALLLPLVLGQEGIFYAEVAAWTGAAVILVSAYFIRMRGRRDGPPQVRPK